EQLEALVVLHPGDAFGDREQRHGQRRERAGQDLLDVGAGPVLVRRRWRVELAHPAPGAGGRTGGGDGPGLEQPNAIRIDRELDVLGAPCAGFDGDRQPGDLLCQRLGEDRLAGVVHVEYGERSTVELQAVGFYGAGDESLACTGDRLDDDAAGVARERVEGEGDA